MGYRFPKKKNTLAADFEKSCFARMQPFWGWRRNAQKWKNIFQSWSPRSSAANGATQACYTSNERKLSQLSEIFWNFIDRPISGEVMGPNVRGGDFRRKWTIDESGHPTSSLVETTSKSGEFFRPHHQKKLKISFLRKVRLNHFKKIVGPLFRFLL